MAGPTDLLNEDVKELKGELRDIRSDLFVLKADIHRIDVGLAEIRAELRTLIGVANGGVKLAAGVVVAFVASIITGAFGGAWWASGINSEVRNLSNQVTEVRKTLESRQHTPLNPPATTPIPITPIPDTSKLVEPKP